MDKEWEGIAGQDSVKELLAAFIENDKVPHALLFNGIEGIGKDYTAIKFASALNKKNSNYEFISKQIKNLREPYIKYIFPLPRGKNETELNDPFEKLSTDEIDLIKEEISQKAKNPYYKIDIPNANTIKVSSIRDIKKFLSLDFSDIGYRIILISNAHYMNEPSQNALLKNLEEPPEGVVFILTTSLVDELRETIRSRCWQINFNPLDYKSITNILINNFDIDTSLAKEVAIFSGGSVSKALVLLNNNFKELKEKTIYILRYSFGGKFNSALSELDTFINQNDYESIRIIIEMIITWLNDLQRFKYLNSEYFYVDFLETLEKFNKRYPDIDVTQLITKLDKLSSSIDNNVGLKSISLYMVFLLSSIIKNY
jgi:DNA polymerase III subunit delta'